MSSHAYTGGGRVKLPPQSLHKSVRETDKTNEFEVCERAHTHTHRTTSAPFSKE